MKSIIPWVLVVALVGGIYFLYSGNRAKETELIQLRQGGEELAKLRVENETLRKTAVENEEVQRLRKDNEDLPRLRGQVRQLREQAKQLTNQVQVLQAQGTQAAQQQQQFRQLAAEHQALQQVNNQGAAKEQMNACINILRRIDGAKQEWALENKKSAAATPTMADLKPYLQNALPVCPADGVYTLNNLSAAPTCSIGGHALQ